MHIPGHFYHVYNRGVNRQRIFAHDGNYRFLLRRTKRYLKDYDLSVIAYCLMPNHYHFLLRPGEDDALSRFIQRLFNSYTQAFNRQHDRSGTLFEGRAKSILVDDERYVLYLCRYIHLNPVKAGLVTHPSEWPYSNYREWVGRRSGTLVDHTFIEADFSTPREYESFVTSDIDQSLEQELQSYYLE
jgi:REP element-mobilizing transposase RayT